MKVYIMLDAVDHGEAYAVAAYTTKESADTHLKINPYLTLRECELNGLLPEHENVIRYEAWVGDMDGEITWKETSMTIPSGWVRRGWRRQDRYCFWSYDSREDALAVMQELKESDNYNKRLDEMQLALYGRLM